MTKNHHLIAIGRVMIPTEAYRDEIAVYISHDATAGPDRISCPGLLIPYDSCTTRSTIYIIMELTAINTTDTKIRCDMVHGTAIRLMIEIRNTNLPVSSAATVSFRPRYSIAENRIPVDRAASISIFPIGAPVFR